MPNATGHVHRNICGASTNVDDHAAEFALVLGCRRPTGGQTLQHEFLKCDPRHVDRLLKVLDHADGS